MKASDFDDIIFRGRNKEYGAYFLRKSYNQAMVSALVLAVLIGIIAVLFPYFRRPEYKSRELYTSIYVTTENLNPPGPMINQALPAPPSLPPRGTSGLKTAMLTYVAPEVVDSIALIEKQVAESDSTSANNEGDGIYDGIADGTGNYAGGIEGGTGGGGGTGLYTEVEVMPQFKGGDINKFREWVQKKTRYPDEATINGIHGKVYITFIVENDGTVSTVKVAKGVDPLIDNEALKAVMSSPKWTPGRLQGIPVRVSYIIMMNFEL